MSAESPEFTPAQLYRVAAVYDFIARLIPTEGRDYAVRLGFPDKDNPSQLSVKMEPYTPFGKVWCDYCMDMMKKARK